jgi:hypothetical protein
VESRLAGGMAEFEQNCPNSTFCTDGVICRVGFMDVQDAIAYAASLENLGFLASDESGSPEIAVFQETTGFVFPCSWLQIAQAELDGGHHAMAAWLLGTNVPQFVAPPGWRPGSSFTLTREEIERDYEYVGIKDGVESRRHRVTGEMVYQGRPRLPRSKRWWEFWK